MSSSSVEGFVMAWRVLIFLKHHYYIQASDSHSYEDPAVLQNFLEIYRSNPSFEMVTVKGSHHLHLNTPERVLPPLLNFIKTLKNINLIEWLGDWGSNSVTINCHEKVLKLNWSIISPDISLYGNLQSVFVELINSKLLFEPQNYKNISLSLSLQVSDKKSSSIQLRANISRSSWQLVMKSKTNVGVIYLQYGIHTMDIWYYNIVLENR